MPGSVSNALPSLVMPYTLCSAFREIRGRETIENQYRNGESQRGALVSTSRKTFEIGKTLTTAQLSTLRAFYDARGGATEPFLFYDIWRTSPKYSYDSTGIVTLGRYTVRFDGEWSETLNIPRSTVSIRLIELA